jgi:hypothetical protein
MIHRKGTTPGFHRQGCRRRALQDTTERSKTSEQKIRAAVKYPRPDWYPKERGSRRPRATPGAVFVRAKPFHGANSSVERSILSEIATASASERGLFKPWIAIAPDRRGRKTAQLFLRLKSDRLRRIAPFLYLMIRFHRTPGDVSPETDTINHFLKYLGKKQRIGPKKITTIKTVGALSKAVDEAK